MKVYIYQKLNKKNIIFLAMLMNLIFLSLLPRYSYANTPANDPNTSYSDKNRLFGYIDGNKCGDKTCKPDEVCQKDYKGVLPVVERDTDKTIFTCVKARPIEAPASIYRKPPLPDSTRNDINLGINTNALLAPLPVDIFNPLPLPVNVTSPTPLPVVVVDDLALYQQKELIDAPLAAKQKAATINVANASIRKKIEEKNLIPNNQFAVNQLATQFGALDKTTGALPQALNQYGNYANFSLLKNEELAQLFRDSQDANKSLFPKETFSEKCGNIRAEDTKTLECTLLGLKTNNNPNGIQATTLAYATTKSNQTLALLDAQVRDGKGYLPTTANNDKNPYTQTVQTPGSTTAALAEKATGATIDQVVASGNNCFEALPKNIMEKTINPILEKGIYDVDSTLNSVVRDVGDVPIDTIRSRGSSSTDLGNLLSRMTGALPDPGQILQDLQNGLVTNLADSISCELNAQIEKLLKKILKDVNIPPNDITLLNIPQGKIQIPKRKIGEEIINAVTVAITDTVNEAAYDLKR